MGSKKKSKKLSFRQRLRNDAAEDLGKLQSKARDAVIQTIIDGGANVSADDLMRSMCGSQTKTLEEQLVTELANEKEVALEKIYNTQLDLIPEKADANEKES
jgi:hypothetical protein